MIDKIMYIIIIIVMGIMISVVDYYCVFAISIGESILLNVGIILFMIAITVIYAVFTADRIVEDILEI